MLTASTAAARIQAARLAVFRATLNYAMSELPGVARSARLTLAPDPHIDPATILPGCRWRGVADFARESIGPATARLAGRYGLHPGMGAVIEEVVAEAILSFSRLDAETVAAVARRAVAGAGVDPCRGK